MCLAQPGTSVSLLLELEHLEQQARSLEPYETAMADLLNEIEEYRSATSRLAESGDRLRHIGAALDSVSADLTELVSRLDSTLGAITSLHLDQLVATIETRYQEHQKALDAIRTSAEEVVREQQRVSLEMLQLTSSNQRQHDDHTNQIKVLAADLAKGVDLNSEAVARTDALLEAMATDIMTTHARLRRVTNLMYALTALVVLFGLLALVG